MALFTNRESTAKKTSGNPYLVNPEKGLSLIRSILSDADAKVGKAATVHLSNVIDGDILPVLPVLDNETQADLFHRLNRLREQATQTKKVNLLAQKVILGVGGQFSAGKSCFINSITNAGLPEDQKPTTSIATYIIHSSEKQNYIISNRDQVIDLDEDALKALTHDFSRQYHIGLSRFIDNLVICSPQFRYPEIVVLDTPGYSKSKIGMREDVSDLELSRKQLRSVDYLIWLMDAKGGDIQQSDLDFIHSVLPDTKVLFILNKADTCFDIEKVIQRVRDTLKEFGDSVFDVVAYNSKQGKTLIGGDALERYLIEVRSFSTKKQNLGHELRSIRTVALDALDKQIADLHRRTAVYDRVIANSGDPLRIRSLVFERAACEEAVQRAVSARSKLDKTFHQLLNEDIFHI